MNKAIRYHILYNNGSEDTITVEITEETKLKLEEVTTTFLDAFKDGLDGVVTLVDYYSKSSSVINVSQVSRVEMSEITLLSE